MIEGFLVIACTVVGLAHGSPQCGSSVVTTNYYPSPVCTSSSVIPVRVIKTNYMSKGMPSMCSDGPETPPLPVIQAPGVTLPTIESPLVALSSPPIPAPRVLCEKCICTKTVIKPQIIQREVTVPKVQRYLKRTFTPVIERVAYTTRPRSCCYSCIPSNCHYNCNCGCLSRKVLYTSGRGGCYSSRIC